MIKLNAAPVLLLYFAKKDGILNKVGLGNFGAPMPIYLDDKLTGIYVDTEKYGLTVSTDAVINYDPNNGNKGNLVLQQKGESQQTVINLIGRRDSIILNMLLPALQSIYSKIIAKKDYRLAYFNKNTLIFNGRLASFEINQTRQNDLVSFSLGIEVPAEESEQGSVMLEGGPFEKIPLKAA